MATQEPPSTPDEQPTEPLAPPEPAPDAATPGADLLPSEPPTTAEQLQRQADLDAIAHNEAMRASQPAAEQGASMPTAGDGQAPAGPSPAEIALAQQTAQARSEPGEWPTADPGAPLPDEEVQKWVYTGVLGEQPPVAADTPADPSLASILHSHHSSLRGRLDHVAAGIDTLLTQMGDLVAYQSIPQPDLSQPMIGPLDKVFDVGAQIEPYKAYEPSDQEKADAEQRQQTERDRQAMLQSILTQMKGDATNAEELVSLTEAYKNLASAAW